MEEQVKKVPFWRSLQTKYAMIYFLVVAAVLLLMNTYPVLSSQDMIFQSKYPSLQSQASVVASALAGADSLTTERVSRVMEALGHTSLARVLVTDPEGLILYDSDSGGGLMGTPAAFPEVREALDGEDIFRSDYRDGAFHSRAATPVTYRGITLGVVYLDELDQGQGQMLESIQKTLANISAVVAVAAVLLSLIFSGALSRRLDALLEAIRTVREGEYSHRVKIKGRDEVTQLAGEFNALTDRLQTTEEVRRRFVSDASHELKTPLASIRLLADSILESEHIAPEIVQEFVGDIGDEAGRLQRITEKLLTLTKLDASAPEPAEAVDLREVALRAQHMLYPLAQSVGVDIHMDLGEGVTVMAGTDGVYQILFNLMENAVKYNLPGGRVDVKVSAEGDKAILVVEDTGVGIPEEDIGKVFDRFYRVDKARSRAAGGTGLGLSIVRDTARRYGGEVTAQRREKEGTRFTVTLPLPQTETA